MQMAKKAVDKVRRGEHRELIRDGDDCLNKTKYIWLTSFGNLSEKQQEVFDAACELLLQTGKAWASKVMLWDLRSQASAASATTNFNDLYKRVIHTKLKPMKTVAESIKERLRNVVNSCTHKITNAVAEGMNSRIMSIKRRVGGCRNRQNFKTALFLHFGGLRLYPQSSRMDPGSAFTHNNSAWTCYLLVASVRSIAVLDRFTSSLEHHNKEVVGVSCVFEFTVCTVF
jgi:transposase